MTTHLSSSQVSLFAPKRFAFLYGATNVRDDKGCPNYSAGYSTGKNSTQYTKGDLLSRSSGYIAPAGANDRLEGVSDATKLMASNNQTVDKKDIPFFAATDEVTFEMDFTADAAKADEGSLFQITGATGAQQVDYSTKSATVGNVALLKLDPRLDGSVRRGLFKFAKTAQAYTIAT